MNKSALRSLAFYGALILVFLFAMQYISHSNDAGKLSYSQMVQLFQQEQVKSFTVQDNTVTLNLSDGSEDRCEITDVTLFREDLGELIQQQWTSGVITDYSYEPDTPPSWISTWGAQPADVRCDRGHDLPCVPAPERRRRQELDGQLRQGPHLHPL